MKNIDDFDAVMLSWKSFEYTHGTADQNRECHETLEKIIENYNRQMARTAKAQKRKPDTEVDSKIVAKKPKNPFEKPEQKKLVETRPKPKKMEVEEAKSTEAQRGYGEKDDVSVFVSNLSYDTTKEQVIAALPELNVKDVTLVIGPNGRSKGYGYIELSNPSEVELALKFDRRPIDGRPAFIARITRDKTTRPAFKYSESLELNKIFIKGLPFDTTKEELQILFGTFGKIKDIRLVTKKWVPFSGYSLVDKKKTIFPTVDISVFRDGKFKGLAFIDYESEKAASKAVATMDSYDLRGLKVRDENSHFLFILFKCILFSLWLFLAHCGHIWSTKKAGRTQTTQLQTGHITWFQSTTAQKVKQTRPNWIDLHFSLISISILIFRSDAKPRLSFIPTSVQRNVSKPMQPAASSSNGGNEAQGSTASTSKSNDYFRQLLNKKWRKKKTTNSQFNEIYFG